MKRSASGLAQSPSLRAPRTESQQTAINVDEVDVDAEAEPESILKHWAAHGEYFLCTICHPKAPTVDESKKTRPGIYAGRLKTLAHRRTPNVRDVEKHNATHNARSSQRTVAPMEYESADAKASALFNTRIPTHKEAWAVSIVFGNIAYCKFEDPYFRGALKYPPPDSRRAAAACVELLYEQTRRDLERDLKNKLVLLCLDGGTCNRVTLMNYTVCPIEDVHHKDGSSERNVRFLMSAPVPNGSAAEIRTTLKAALEQLRTMDVVCVGACTDNASAMAAALRDDDELTTEDLDGMSETPAIDEIFNFDNVEEGPDAAEGWDESVFGDEAELSAFDEASQFFVHIRCWCHTMQLVVGDIAKHQQLNPGMNLMKKILALSRGDRALLQLRAVNHGVARTRIVQPACTRWNSFTRAGFRMLELQEHIEALWPMLAKKGEWFSLRLFVLVTAPFAWATDVLQSDGATLTTASGCIDRIREHLSTVDSEAEKIRAVEVQATVQAMVEFARQRLRLREETYLVNDVTKMLKLLDNKASAMDADEEDWILDKLRRWTITTGASFNGMEREIKDFRNRGMVMRAEPSETFWNRSSFTAVGGIRQKLLNVIASEASVERSFQIQDGKWSKLRNRTASSTIDKEVFIRMNYNAQEEKVPRAGRRDDISLEEWHRVLETVAEDEFTGRRRTRGALKPQADALRSGSSIWLDVKATDALDMETFNLKLRCVVTIVEEAARVRLWNATNPQTRSRAKPRGREFTVSTEVPEHGDDVSIETYMDCGMVGKTHKFNPEVDTWEFRAANVPR